MLNNTNQPRYHFYHSTVLHTSLKQVWTQMRDFANTLKIAKQDDVEDINWYDGGSIEQIPSKIQFIVQPGNHLVTEEVIARNEIEPSLTYRTVGQALSMVDYVGNFTFKPITDELDKTFLEWRGEFSLIAKAQATEFLAFYTASRAQQIANIKSYFTQ